MRKLSGGLYATRKSRGKMFCDNKAAVIPDSANPDHIRENLDLFHFELSEEEMERINALDRNEKHDWY